MLLPSGDSGVRMNIDEQILDQAAVLEPSRVCQSEAPDAPFCIWPGESRCVRAYGIDAPYITALRPQPLVEPSYSSPWLRGQYRSVGQAQIVRLAFVLDRQRLFDLRTQEMNLPTDQIRGLREYVLPFTHQQ